MIETQFCKDCEGEYWTTSFKLNENTGLRHALCDFCRDRRREEHNTRWEYYHR